MALHHRERSSVCSLRSKKPVLEMCTHTGCAGYFHSKHQRAPVAPWQSNHVFLVTSGSRLQSDSEGSVCNELSSQQTSLHTSNFHTGIVCLCVDMQRFIVPT